MDRIARPVDGSAQGVMGGARNIQESGVCAQVWGCAEETCLTCSLGMPSADSHSYSYGAPNMRSLMEGSALSSDLIRITRGSTSCIKWKYMWPYRCTGLARRA